MRSDERISRKGRRSAEAFGAQRLEGRSKGFINVETRHLTPEKMDRLNTLLKDAEGESDADN